MISITTEVLLVRLIIIIFDDAFWSRSLLSAGFDGNGLRFAGTCLHGLFDFGTLFRRSFLLNIRGTTCRWIEGESQAPRRWSRVE